MPLNEVEQNAKRIYTGEYAPLLTLNPDGTIDVSDGRHRMQALKELGISTQMDVTAYLYIEPIQEINEAFLGKKRFFKRKEQGISAELKYFVMEQCSKNKNLVEKYPGQIIFIRDVDTDKEYIFVSKDNVNSNLTIKQEIIEISKDVPVFYTKDKLYQSESIER